MVRVVRARLYMLYTSGTTSSYFVESLLPIWGHLTQSRFILMDIYFLKQFDGFVKDSIWDLCKAHTPYPLESFELLFEGAHTFAGSLSGNCDTD